MTAIRFAFLCGVLGVALRATGQVGVGPEVLVAAGTPGTSGVSLSETTVATAIGNSNHVLVGFNEETFPGGATIIGYGISTNAAISFPTVGTVQPPPSSCDSSSEVDPFSVALAGGDMLLGGMVGNGDRNHSRVFVVKKPIGSGQLSYPAVEVTTLCETPADKPGIAAGIRTSGSGQAVYPTWFWTGQTNFGTQFAKSTDGGATWPGSGTYIDIGGVHLINEGTAPVVLSGSPNVGRVVVVGSGQQSNPQATFSVDEGATWSFSGPVDPNLGFGLFHYGNGSATPLHDIGDLLGVPVPPMVHALTYPSASVDPRDGRTVFAVFAARDAATTDIDLFVAISFDGAGTFDPQNIYRLSDTQLLVSGESYTPTTQLQPAVVIDPLGGINIAYINIRSGDITDSGPKVTVRYARFASVSQLTSNPGYIQDLTSAFPLTNHLQINMIENEYLGLAGSGCVLYAAYARTNPTDGPDGVGSVYVRRINVGPCARADVDANNVVNPADVTAFGSAFGSGQWPADVNLDGIVNVQDAVDFTAAYTCGCNPP